MNTNTTKAVGFQVGWFMGDPDYVWHCEKCNENPSDSTFSSPRIGKFCPHCGAKIIEIVY